jgi:hypothetical protein
MVIGSPSIVRPQAQHRVTVFMVLNDDNDELRENEQLQEGAKGGAPPAGVF